MHCPIGSDSLAKMKDATGSKKGEYGAEVKAIAEITGMGEDMVYRCLVGSRRNEDVLGAVKFFRSGQEILIKRGQKKFHRNRNKSI